MEHYIAPQTYVFKLKCPKCQKKVKKLLSRLNGVYSIKIEGEAGRVSVMSTVQPNTLASILGEAVTKQEYYSCEELPVTFGYSHNHFEGYEMADLHELAKTQRLKQLEFTQTKNLKMTFHEEMYDGPSQQAGSDKGPQPEPKKAEDPGEFEGSPSHSTIADPDCFGGSPSHCASALPQESNGSRSSHLGVCPPPQCAVAHSRPHFTPSSYHHHHMPPPYHGYFYPPPPYHGHPPVAAPPAKASCADLSCENVARCRMM